MMMTFHWIDDGDYVDDTPYEDEYQEPRLEEDSLADWLEESRKKRREVLRMAYTEKMHKADGPR